MLLHLQRLTCFNPTKWVATIMRNREISSWHWVYLYKLFYLIILKGTKLYIATVHSLFKLWLRLILNYNLSATQIWFRSTLDLAIKVLDLSIAKHKLVAIHSLKVLYFLRLLHCVVLELFVNHYPNLLFWITLQIHVLVLCALLTSAFSWHLHLQLL